MELLPRLTLGVARVGHPADEHRRIEIAVLDERKRRPTIRNEAVRRHPRAVDAQCVEDGSGRMIIADEGASGEPIRCHEIMRYRQ